MKPNHELEETLASLACVEGLMKDHGLYLSPSLATNLKEVAMRLKERASKLEAEAKKAGPTTAEVLELLGFRKGSRDDYWWGEGSEVCVSNTDHIQLSKVPALIFLAGVRSATAELKSLQETIIRDYKL